jgi:hypothetical protein
MSRGRMLVLVGALTTLAAAVAAASCQVYTRASFDVDVGAGYRVRTYRVRTPLRIAGDTASTMGPHPTANPGWGTDGGYETWLVRDERRVVRVSGQVPRPAAVRADGRFYAYLAPDARPLLRVVRVRDGRAVEHGVPREAYVFWEGTDAVRLVDRDPRGAITFQHEVRLEAAFLAEP